MDTIGEWGRGYRGTIVGGNPWILWESGGGATGALMGGNPWILLGSGGGATRALMGGDTSSIAAKTTPFCDIHFLLFFCAFSYHF